MSTPRKRRDLFSKGLRVGRQGVCRRAYLLVGEIAGWEGVVNGRSQECLGGCCRQVSRLWEVGRESYLGASCCPRHGRSLLTVVWEILTDHGVGHPR